MHLVYIYIYIYTWTKIHVKYDVCSKSVEDNIYNLNENFAQLINFERTSANFEKKSYETVPHTFLTKSFGQSTELFKWSTCHTQQILFWAVFSYFLYSKFISSVRLEDVEHIKEIQLCSFTSHQKWCLRGTSNNKKLVGIIVLNTKGTILKKIKVSAIVQSVLIQFLSLYFLTHLVCRSCRNKFTWIFYSYLKVKSSWLTIWICFLMTCQIVFRGSALFLDDVMVFVISAQSRKKRNICYMAKLLKRIGFLIRLCWCNEYHDLLRGIEKAKTLDFFLAWDI